MARIRQLKTGHGDITLAEWEPGCEELVQNARETFTREFTSGRLAYRILGVGVQEIVRSVDDVDWSLDADLLIVPAVTGG